MQKAPNLCGREMKCTTAITIYILQERRVMKYIVVSDGRHLVCGFSAESHNS